MKPTPFHVFPSTLDDRNGNGGAPSWLARAQWLLVVTAVVGSVLLSGVAAALAAPADAAKYLQQKQGALTRHVKSGNDAQIKAAMQELLDFEALAKQSLGDAWDKRSPKERAEFVGLLTRLVECNYENNIRSTLNYEVKFIDEKTEADNVLVKSEARSKKSKRKPPVGIDYRVSKRGNQYVIVDIITDNVSLVSNYRAQFSRILSKDGWKGLMQRMNKKAASERCGG